MAFVVEDGTGLSDSNSYITVDEFKDYWMDRGVEFNQSTSQIQGFLVRSTDYIDSSYNYNGIRANEDQALQFPRRIIISSRYLNKSLYNNSYDNIYDKRINKYIANNEIPISVKYALCELANIASTSPDLYGSNDGISSKSLGKASVTYNNSGSSDLKEYRAVERYLNGLFISCGMVRV